ncbi:MAG: thioredoxin family protein [Pseudomonadota bacterium]|nr:thioredoxin family protein [Pseudomonadota bacterium]
MAERPLVACLCAEWCDSCRDYRGVFSTLAARFAGRADFIWIDIEDQATLLGEVEVENFPTLLIVGGDPGAVRFFGAVTPQPAVAERLVHEALNGTMAASCAASAEVDAMARRLRLRSP